MTRSTLISPALWFACVGACLLGAPAESIARPEAPPSIQDDDSHSDEPEVYSGPDDLPSDVEAQPQTPSPAKALPPRSASPAASGDSSSRRNMVSMPEGTWRTIGALGAVIGLIVLVRSLIKRFGGPLGRARAPSGIVEVLGRYPLARSQTLLLLKVDRRVLLLAQTPQGLTTLSELSDAEQVASLLERIRNERGDSFSRQFERLVTPVRSEQDGAEGAPTVIDLTRSTTASAAQRIASMLADGGRR